MPTNDPGRATRTKILAELGIPPSYGVERDLPIHAEATELVSVGLDIYDRERHLTPGAAALWTELQSAARQDGITLLLVSAFRSFEHQRQIFVRKLQAGDSLEQILRVNLPPGFSEHHTGRAVDLTTPGCAPLVESFEETAAFSWLMQNARRFDFSLTYPRENRFGIAYEPWHWAARETGS